MANEQLMRRAPKVGGRYRTMTIHADDETIAKVDRAALANKRSRARFLTECVSAGYRALKEQGWN